MHTVVSTPGFLRAGAKAGLSKAEIDTVINLVAADPDIGEMMQGTGGFRKFRFAGRGKGKRGGYRVISFYTGRGMPVFLIDVFSKGEKANLSPAQCSQLKKIGKTIVDGYRDRVI